jgi:hypothetical protein
MLYPTISNASVARAVAREHLDAIRFVGLSDTAAIARINAVWCGLQTRFV